MTDDQGYGDFGFTGNPAIATPNLDLLAANSALMNPFYVHPVCAPTRACLMTGRYNYRTRAIDTYIGRAMMEPEEITLAEILKENGYATGIFGKWHLGDNHPMRPQDQGFDEVLVHRGGGIGQPSDPLGAERKYTDPALLHNGKLVSMKGYCTDLYFDHAWKWIEDQHPKEPFFAYIPTNAPHGPFHDVPEDLYDDYRSGDLGNDRFPTVRGHPLPEKSNSDRRARIFAMISNIDENIGRLLDRLRKRNILNNSLIIFLTDNGPNGRRYVSGMRGSKGTVYEGGIRTPLLLHWPDAIKPGMHSDRITAHIDIMPTIMDACNIQPSRDLNLDGRSILPLLLNKEVHWEDRAIIIQAHRGNEPMLYHNFMIRTQEWKLVHASGFGRETFEGEPKFELYNMQTDPLEMIDVASKYPDKVQELLKSYESWFDDVGSTRPDNYAPPRIHVGTPHENPVVLTRQDWRHEKGHAWGRLSNGHWQLYAAHSGPYQIKLYSLKEEWIGDVTLKFGGKLFKSKVNRTIRSIEFPNLSIQPGETILQAIIQTRKEVQGPYQVEVTWRP